MPIRQPPRTVVLLAHEHMNVLDLTGPVQALHTANRCRPESADSQRYVIVVASEHGGLVTTSSGLQVMSACIRPTIAATSSPASEVTTHRPGLA